MTTFERVKEIITVALGCEEKDITLEAKLVDDLGADSLEVVEITMAIEEEFGLEIPDDQVKHIKRVNDVIEYVENHQ